MTMHDCPASQTPSTPHAPHEQQAIGPAAYSASPSTSSLRVDNAGALTPPATPRLRPIPLPEMSIDNTTLNTLVTYASPPHIQYDVRCHPSSASAATGIQHWSEEQATYPPMPNMVISCTVLSRPFVVHPARKDLGYVTVGDLIAATHDAFREAAQEGVVDNDESLVSDFSIWSDTPNGKYIWAGLSDQTAPRTWLLHLE